MQLVRTSARVERSDHAHEVRLLILLRSAEEARPAKTIEGITKLAKLDFFLRYPTYLERLLHALNKPIDAVAVTARERESIEAAMIRFRYGPWDRRYRRWLTLLNSRGLVDIRVSGNTVHVGLTEVGRSVAASIADSPAFADWVRRGALIGLHLSRLTGTRLKSLVYEVFPEIVTLKWGDDIRP
jgi:hypothetical protein